jgi:hypothetical protein
LHKAPQISWWAYVTVFLASGAALTLELVAARVVAPQFGVSLYTWSSVIGILLASITVGNFAGGRVADRWPTQRTLGLVLAAGGISGLATLPLIQASLLAIQVLPLPFLVGLELFIALIFFPPAFFVSMVTPIVVKLTLQSTSDTGGVVGRLYAVATAGSILMTFLTGFVLISALGTRGLALAVALVLLSLAFATGGLIDLNAGRK